jgi:hypothetical protein
MTLALPEPATPSLRTQRQAFRHWQTGQGHARQQRWPAAALAFSQASELHGDEA